MRAPTLWIATAAFIASLPIAAHAAPAPIVISSCPYVITDPGFYVMQGSVGSTGGCITIEAKNVTLGVDGYFVNNGAPGTGAGILIAKGATGAIVRGGAGGHNIDSFAIGIDDEAGDAIAGDLVITNSAQAALLLNGASSIATRLDDILAQGGSGDGIDVTARAGVRMVDTSAFAFGAHGIFLDARSSGSVLGGVSSAENTGTNIDIAGSGNTVSYCGEGFGQYGIVVEKGAGNNVITGCSSSGYQPPSIEDAVDKNANCGTNAWFDDVFASANRSCIDHPSGGVPLASCQTISSSGGYFLTGDLTNKTGDCLDIRAPNVGLFLAGYTINGGKSGIGVHVRSTAAGFRGIGGRNGSEIFGFKTGIEIDADGALFDDTGAENAADTGILVKGANDVTLGANDGSNAGRFGYRFSKASRTLLHNYSALSNGAYGVFLEHATDSLLNQFEAGAQGGANGIAGIYLGCSLTGPGAACAKHPSNGNTIAHGSAAYNSEYGIAVDAGADRNVLVNLTTGGNGGDDVYDGNANCANNLWFFDVFTTSNNAACMNQ